jgi:hypothetical protein
VSKPTVTLKYFDDDEDPEWNIFVDGTPGPQRRWAAAQHIERREDAEIMGRALAEHYGCELVIEVGD